MRLYAVRDCRLLSCRVTPNLMRGRVLELPLKPLLHIAFVTDWCSAFQSCKPLSLFSFRVIVILLSAFSVGSRASVFYFLKCQQIFLNNFSRCVGFASSLTKLWMERWLVGLWQCACKWGYSILLGSIAVSFLIKSLYRSCSTSILLVSYSFKTYKIKSKAKF